MSGGDQSSLLEVVDNSVRVEGRQVGNVFDLRDPLVIWEFIQKVA